MSHLVGQQAQIGEIVTCEFLPAELHGQRDLGIASPAPAYAGGVSFHGDDNFQIQGADGRGMEHPGQLIPHQISHFAGQHLVRHAATPVNPFPSRIRATASAAMGSKARRRAW